MSLPSVLGDVQCEGTEPLLSDCRADTFPTGSCGDAAVLCQSMFQLYLIHYDVNIVICAPGYSPNIKTLLTDNNSTSVKAQHTTMYSIILLLLC